MLSTKRNLVRGNAMRILITCQKCENLKDHSGGAGFVLYSTDLLDEGFVKLHCENGHHTLMTINAHKFELLAEVGMNAIVDGYRREAVSSFSSALERFQEFYIRVAATSKNLPVETVNAAWKPVSRQSERQLGAFIFVHTLTEGTPPPMLASKCAEFRNDVIHKGAIPTEQEATNYAQAVIDVINPTLGILRAQHASAVRKLENARLAEGAFRRSTEPAQQFLMEMETLLSASRKSHAQSPTVEQWVQKQKQRREQASGIRVVPVT
jgi:hypothetical protein